MSTKLLNSYFLDPIHLYNAPANMLMVPDANCSQCRYREDPYGSGNCYFFKVKPGAKCGQFKEGEL
jgi:hypothetical protein